MRLYGGHRLDRLTTITEETDQPCQPLSQRGGGLKHNAYASQASNHHISEPEMWYQKTLRAPGLLGFEVQLSDQKQRGAWQGLYQSMWPTSVWCALHLTCFSLTPIMSFHALDTNMTQAMQLLFLRQLQRGRWMPQHRYTVIILFSSIINTLLKI